MTTINSDAFTLIGCLGFKQAKPTNFWIHSDSAVAFYIEDIGDGNYKLEFPSVDKGFITQDGYIYVTYLNKVYRFHTLKALAFLPLPETLKALLGEDWTYNDLKKNKIVINHKDGNKENNDIDNIEWSTYRENNIHAFQSGLRADNFFGSCYDVVEDIEFEFYSINQLGRDLGIHADYISRYLNSPRMALFMHRYMIRKAGEADYPHRLTHDDMWKRSIGGIEPIESLNMNTKKIRDFAGPKLLTDALKINPIKKRLFTSKDSVYRIQSYELRPICDYERIMKIKSDHDKVKRESIDTNRKITTPFSVIATQPNGEVLEFKSRKEAAKHFGTTDVALKARLSKYDGWWKGIHFKYGKRT